jgi:DNA invertase Pin-like site-specific DNA recombinase
MKIGCAYIRVSTDDQLEYSPDSQLKLIQQFAKKNDIIIP